MKEKEDDAYARLQQEKLEYILDMLEQLADIAGGMDECKLGGLLRGAAESRRGGGQVGEAGGGGRSPRLIDGARRLS